MSKLQILVKYWLPPVLWAIVIFSFSSMQVGGATEVYWKDFIVKKTAHLIEYGILAMLVYRALLKSGVKIKKAMWISVLTALLYGMTDEFHQSFTPGRGPSIRDVIIDTIGAILFVYGVIGNIKKMPLVLQKAYNSFILPDETN